MNVVAVFPAVPQPFGDTAARWFYVLVKELLQRGFRISSLVVSEERREAADEAFRRLEGFGARHQARFLAFSPQSTTHVVARKLRSLWRPFSETYYAPGLRDALVSELQRGYDVLHLEQLWSGWAGVHQARSLLNVHHFEIIDREGAGPRRFGERKALWQMRRATTRILQGNDAMRVFTPRLLERARTINATHQPYDRRPSAIAHATQLAEALSLDMSVQWSATKDN